MKRKFLLTGNTGLVGHGICQHLLNSGFPVWGTSLIAQESRHPGFTPLLLDISQDFESGSLGDCVSEVDTLIHNAAFVPKGVPLDEQGRSRCFETNANGTLRVLEMFARMPNATTFILISGTALVDHSRSPITEEAAYVPKNIYYSSKIASELLCQQFHLEGKIKNLVILRISAPYGFAGSRLAVLPKMLDLARHGKDLTLWGTGSRSQTFTFVEDVAHACLLATEREKSGIYNVTGGNLTSMKELAETILSVCPGSTSKIVYSGNPDPQEGKRVEISIDKAKRELGYSPQYTLASGLKKIVSFDQSELFFTTEGTEPS